MKLFNFVHFMNCELVLKRIISVLVENVFIFIGFLIYSAVKHN